MDTSARWAELIAELHENRLNWATETYDQFLADLAPAIRREMPSAHPRVTASLYGETQVGKTTLLLTLLGVDPDRMEEIGETLRAGRPAGMSATPTATRYRAAATDTWTWRVGPEQTQELTEAQIRQQIVNVRAAVEGGRWPLDRVVEIGVPASYFTERHNVTIDVLDLPGVNAVNAQEDRHARLLLDTWINASDIVILVALVNHLPPLRPTALGIEALRHWPQQLGKFRIVLTYAYTNLNTKEWLAATPPGDRTVRTLRADIRDAFDTANWPALEHSDLSWLYPLEFGRSWSTLTAGCAGRPAVEIRDEALRQLREDLARAVRPINRLRRAFEARAFAESVRTARKRKLDLAVEAAKLEVRRQDRLLNRLTGILQQIEIELASLNEASRQIAAVRPAKFRPPPPADVISRRELPDIAEAEHQLSDEFRKLWSTWRATEQRLRTNLPNTIHHNVTWPSWDQMPTQIDQIIKSNFAPIRDRTGARRRTIFQRIAGRYYRQMAEDFRGAYERASSEIADAVDRGARKRVSAIRGRIVETTAGYEHRQRAVKKALVDARRALAAATANAEERQQQRKHELNALDEHVRVAGQFPARIETGYLEQRAGLLRALAAATSPIQAVAASLAVLDCARTYDTIRYGG